MKSVALKAYPRSQVQRAEVKKLRAAGRVPATIYGRQAKPQNLEVNFEEITDLLHHSASENLLVDLSVENDARSKRLALVQEVQHHPLDGKVLHVDLHEVAENEKVTVQVPVETTGEAAGVKNGGGMLEHVLFKLKVRCLPKDLPEQIVIDVTALGNRQGHPPWRNQTAGRRGNFGRQAHPVVAVAAPRAEEEAALRRRGSCCRRRRDDQGKEGRRRGRRAPAAGAKPARKPRPRAMPKPPLRRATKRPRQSRKPRQPRRRNNLGERDRGLRGGGCRDCAGHETRHPGALTWKIFFSSWAWEIRARNTRRRATTPAFCWSKNWRRNGGASGATKEISARGWPAPNATAGRFCCAEPQTFMNLSGESVAALADFYHLPLERILVVVDDADLPLGEIRLRPGGSSGGHHGLESIEQHLGSREYARLRIGIGRKDGVRQITGMFWGSSSAAENDLLEKVLERAAEQMECWLDAGIQKAMNQFNGAVTSHEQKKK